MIYYINNKPFRSPDLTWRDVQYLCVETARIVNADDQDWEKTATGRLYSYKYGYGALDAYAFVKAAQSWSLVKPQTWLSTDTVRLNNGTMDSQGNFTGGQFIGPEGIESTITITKEMVEGNNLENLEHINVKVWIEHTRRGDVEVEVRSPSGIKSVLAAKRQYDTATTGFPGWTFMSVKHWWVSLCTSFDPFQLLSSVGVRIPLVLGRFVFPIRTNLDKTTTVPSSGGI